MSNIPHNDNNIYIAFCLVALGMSYMLMSGKSESVGCLGTLCGGALGAVLCHGVLAAMRSSVVQGHILPWSTEDWGGWGLTMFGLCTVLLLCKSTDNNDPVLRWVNPKERSFQERFPRR